MAKIGYHLITPEALPRDFWQITDEDQETIRQLGALERSFRVFRVCWLVWERDQSTFYEQRGIYRCAVVKVILADALGKSVPYGDLRKRESVAVFFSADAFKRIMALQPLEDQTLSAETLLACRGW